MRVYLIPILMLAPLALAACGSNDRYAGASGGENVYITDTVQPYHPSPGQKVIVPGLRPGETAIINRFGEVVN